MSNFDMDDLEYARMVQQQLIHEERIQAQRNQQQREALAQFHHQAAHATPPSRQHEDQDSVMARRLQELLDSGHYDNASYNTLSRALGVNDESHTQPVHDVAFSQNDVESERQRLRQEENDAHLARIMAERGMSLRDIDQTRNSFQMPHPEAHSGDQEPEHSDALVEPPAPLPPTGRTAATIPISSSSPGEAVAATTTVVATPIVPPPDIPQSPPLDNQRRGIPFLRRSTPQSPKPRSSSSKSPVVSSRHSPSTALPRNLPTGLPLSAAPFSNEAPTPVTTAAAKAGLKPPPPNPNPRMMDAMGDQVFLDVPPEVKPKKKRILNGLFGRKSSGDTESEDTANKSKPKGRFRIRRGKATSDDTNSSDEPVGEGTPEQSQSQLGEDLTSTNPGRRTTAMCVVCNQPAEDGLSALGSRYHIDCFRCASCQDLIDPHDAFSFVEQEGLKQPMHLHCYADAFGIRCCVCKNTIPTGDNGQVTYAKHPFFDTEKMCPIHAVNNTRRCTGCHRYEPEDEPFLDLGDGDRCVCLSCCRTVVVDSQEAQPIWEEVVLFFRDILGLRIWPGMEDVPILVVTNGALTDQMNSASHVHGGSSQIMTRGLCLTEHACGHRFRSNRMKFDEDVLAFVAADAESRGFTLFQVPDVGKANPNSSVTAILCLSGLPRELTASVLAHEATHAWIKLHPMFNLLPNMSPQVEEGCAQLVAMLFLDHLSSTSSIDSHEVAEDGPSDVKLRQYFKFSIETDDNDVYGTGYRKAAEAYSLLGMEALLEHVVRYKKFPTL